jgi:hypothetical protein
MAAASSRLHEPVAVNVPLPPKWSMWTLPPTPEPVGSELRPTDASVGVWGLVEVVARESQMERVVREPPMAHWIPQEQPQRATHSLGETHTQVAEESLVTRHIRSA